MKRRKQLWIGLMVTLVVGLGSFGGFRLFKRQQILRAEAALNGPAVQGVSVLAMQDFAFDVPHIQVKPGTTVTWTNRDDDQHDVLFFDGTRGPMLNQTQTYQWTFAEPGVYQYVCSAHAQMRGKVTVADDQTALANDE